MTEPREPHLHSYLATNPVFERLDEEALRALEPCLELVHLAAGDVLCRQGDHGDAMYVLVHGELGITRETTERAPSLENRIVPGESVGEMALLTGQPRTATVVATTTSTLVKRPKHGFDALAAERPEVVAELARSTLPSVQRTQLLDVLVRLFGRLDSAAVRDLHAEVEWLSLASGDILIRQGEPGDAMFMVICGRLRIITVDDNGVEHVLRELGAGQSVGEFALLTDEPRSATAYAIRDTTVVKLSRLAFERIMQRYPRGLMEMTRQIVKERYAAPPHADVVVGATIALLPVGPGVPLRDFARRLTEALSAIGPTIHLDAARADALTGRSGIAQLPADHPITSSLLAWLDEREREHRYVVYEADGDWSNWSQRCMRQADRVLLVANAGDDPEPGTIELALAQGAAKGRRELVLVQADECTRPSGTRRWLDRRHVSAHHHVRLRNAGDIERLARRLTGRAWGFVLGGGGARGYAHVGVYRALLEAGIPIDFVGGTSMGAVLGACIAMGHDYLTIRSLAAQLSSPLRLFDPTLPVVALFAGEKVTRTLKAVYDDRQMEDLWCPFFCVSSNLTRASETVHIQGDVWRAVRASMAIPGIFSPVLCDGELHTDGAVLNNLPIDVMAELNHGGPIVAVNVVPEVDLATPYRFGPSISGSRALLSKLLPGDTVNVPSIFETIIRVVELNDVLRARVKHRLASIYIKPAVGRFGMLEFGAWPQIVDAGYNAAIEALGRATAGQVPPTAARATKTEASPNHPLAAVRDLDRALDELDRVVTALADTPEEHS